MEKMSLMDPYSFLEAQANNHPEAKLDPELRALSAKSTWQ